MEAFVLPDGLINCSHRNEILSLVADITKRARDANGMDYLQIYHHANTKMEVWVIDKLSRTELQQLNHAQQMENHYAIILLPQEY